MLLKKLNILTFWWFIITINDDNDDDDGANYDANDDAHPLHLLLNGGHGECGLDNLGGLHASSECHHIETSKGWEKKRLPETIIIKTSPACHL